MIEEFAVEPAAVATSIADFNNIVDRFGIDRGRVISDFAGGPGNWVNKVRVEANARLQPRARLDLVERLTQAARDLTILRMREDYSAVDDWLPNVLRSDRAKPWSGIITTDGRAGHANECASARVDNRIPWLRDRDLPRVPRTTEALSAVFKPLLSLSRHVVLVDPYVTFDSTTRRREQWAQPLAAYVAAAVGGRELGSLEIHTAADDASDPRWSRRPDARLFEQACRTTFLPLLPRGVRIQFSRWRERPSDQLLHERLVLTEIGGFRVDAGLDARPGDLVPVTRLSRETCLDLKHRYIAATSPYIFADGFTILKPS